MHQNVNSGWGGAGGWGAGGWGAHRVTHKIVYFDALQLKKYTC